MGAGTRERIEAAARELSYRPNFAGRALKSARTRVLGLVVPDLTNAVFTELMHGAEDEARAHGYTLLLGRADGPLGQEVIDRLIGEGRVDGVIVQVSDGVPPRHLTEVLGSGAPVVLINSRAEGRPGSVALDDRAGAWVATQHLLSLGHRRIAFANGLPRSFTAQRRREGWQDALTEAGVSVLRGYETRIGYRYNDGVDAFHRLLAHAEPPTGIVVANVNAAVGVISAARLTGIRVPDQISVVAIHDSWTGQNTGPPLTAVKMPLYEMGRWAARDLVARIDTGAVTDREIDAPPELVVRESTAPPFA